MGYISNQQNHLYKTFLIDLLPYELLLIFLHHFLNYIHLDYLDYNGKKKSLKATGLLATCIQHEIDHLNGILFIDYLSKLKKDMIIKKLKKQKKELDKAIL